MTNATRKIGSDRRIEALTFAWRMGGWITSVPLAWWLWPDSDVRRQYAQRLIAKLITEKLLIRRPLPTGGIAGALTQSGRDMLYRPESPLSGRWLSKGTGWGDLVNGKWQPPARWDHDERVARFLAWHRAARGGAVIFERELRTRTDHGTNDLRKIPDGILITEDGAGIWVECENARKSGGARWHLIDHMAQNTAGTTAALHPRGCDPVQVGPLSILVVPAEYDEAALRRHINKRLPMIKAPEVRYRLAVDLGDRFELSEVKHAKSPIGVYIADAHGLPKEKRSDVLVLSSGGASEPDLAGLVTDDERITFCDPLLDEEEVTITGAEWQKELAALSADEKRRAVELMTMDNQFNDHSPASAIERWRWEALQLRIEAAVQELPENLQGEYARDCRAGKRWTLKDVEKRAKHEARAREWQQRAEAKRSEEEAAARARAEKDKKWLGFRRLFD